MPVTKSAQKAWRQNARRRKRNLSKNKTLKAEIKNYKKLVAAGKIAEAEKYISKVYKLLDKSAKTGLIKKNKSSRLKSRLSRQLKTKSTKTSS